MSVQSHSMRPIVARKHSGIERRHPSIGQPREVDARIKPEIAPKVVTHPLKVPRFDYFQPQLHRPLLQPLPSSEPCDGSAIEKQFVDPLEIPFSFPGAKTLSSHGEAVS
jgi:hypothetical protein